MKKILLGLLLAISFVGCNKRDVYKNMEFDGNSSYTYVLVSRQIIGQKIFTTIYDKQTLVMYLVVNSKGVHGIEVIELKTAAGSPKLYSGN